MKKYRENYVSNCIRTIIKDVTSNLPNDQDIRLVRDILQDQEKGPITKIQRDKVDEKVQKVFLELFDFGLSLDGIKKVPNIGRKIRKEPRQRRIYFGSAR